jgi:hypothetical protein
MGAIISEAPTPRPPIIRAITNVVKVVASADPNAEIAKSTAASLSTALRSMRSLSAPEKHCKSSSKRERPDSPSQFQFCKPEFRLDKPNHAGNN